MNDNLTPSDKDEIARQGSAIYEQRIRPKMKNSDKGKVVAIDIQSGAYEIAGDVLEASDRLLSKFPDACVWLVRVGRRALHRFGALDQSVLMKVKDVESLDALGSLHRQAILAGSLPEFMCVLESEGGTED